MTKITWLVDPAITERTSYHTSLLDVIKNHGHRLIQYEYKVGDTIEGPDVEGCVVLYGSHQFTRAINPHGKLQPAALGVNDRTHVTQYMSNLPLDWFLNRQAVMTTWRQFRDRALEWFDIFPGEGLFVRPNSGFKTFAGQCVTKANWDDDLHSIDQLSSVMPDTLIVVAPLREMIGEFRFVIADRKVIAGSEYRWDNRLDVRRDWPEDCFTLAEKVAQHDWQVDIAYVADVALTEDGPRLIELNSFSCAGLYACDLDKVVEGVSLAAYKEYMGD